jgi:NADH dehydrogenase FAD-containing subunit
MTKNDKDKYKLLIVGGGTGGLSTGSKFLRKLGKGQIALVDSAKWHCTSLLIIIFIKIN